MPADIVHLPLYPSVLISDLWSAILISPLTYSCPDEYSVLCPVDVAGGRAEGPVYKYLQRPGESEAPGVVTRLAGLGARTVFD